jgi:DNA polymerase-1
MFRAYFALPPELATRDGQQTNALHGLAQMLVRLLERREGPAVAVAFDLPEPTFRDEILPSYKAQRPRTPEGLVAQVVIAKRLLQAIGVPVVEVPGYEADDVLATLAAEARAARLPVVIVTGDRDAFQLVEDPWVRVLYTRKGLSDTVLYDEHGIEQRTGVPPKRYPLLALLRGDPSDNLPGVPGIGEKTAAGLANRYSDLDTLLEHLDELPERLRRAIAERKENLRTLARLVPLVRDVPLPVGLRELRRGPVDVAAARRVFEELELRTAWRRIEPLLEPADPGGAGVRHGDAGREAPGAREPMEVLDEPQAACRWLAALASQLEAIGAASGRVGGGRGPAAGGKRSEAAAGARASGMARPSEGELVAWCRFEATPGRSPILGVALAGVGGPEGSRVQAWLEGRLLDDERVRDVLGRLLGRSGARVVGHDLKPCMRALLERGIDVRDLALDTAVAAYLVDPTRSEYSLAELAVERGLGTGSLDEGAGTPPRRARGAEDRGRGRGASAVQQGAAALEVIANLAPRLREELEGAGLARLYEEIERPLTRVLARMEVAGVAVDRERLASVAAELAAEARRLEREVQRLAGEEFNVNSPAQLRRVLYERLGLAPQRRTKTGWSTDAASLERLRGEHPVVDALLHYREVEKLRSTYGEPLLAEVGPDGRIHATFHQTVARTGRLSSERPNLHNIPVRTEEGRRIREAFVAGPGRQLLVADYDQIELRVIAHLSGDEGLMRAFATHADVHRMVAASVFGVPPEEVTPLQRSRAKMVSYGLLYGMEAYGLARRLGIETSEAQAILDAYFRAFPGVQGYLRSVIEEARERGYTETLLGRRRPIPELRSPDGRVRQAAERQAMNAGVQGLAADLFKVALVRLDACLEAAGERARLVLQVHDEVLVEAPQDEAAELAPVVQEVLEGVGQVADLRVPLEVTVRCGSSWAEAKG